MARYRKVDPRIWNDAKFIRIGPMGQMMFLYILTHPNMTMLGMLRSTKEAIAFERGWDLLAFNQVFELALRLGLLEYDPLGLIACPNFLKYNEPESLTVVKSWGKIQDILPECDLYFKYINRAKEYCQKRGEAFSKAFSEAFAEAKLEPNLEPSDLFSVEPRAYQRTKNKEQISTTKKEKVEKEKAAKNADPDVNLGAAQKRGTQFSLEALPDDWAKVAEELAPDIDPQKAFDDFADYWRGIPGEKGRKKDWMATWRNSLRNIPEWKRKNLLKANAQDSGKKYREPWDEPGYYGDPERDWL